MPPLDTQEQADEAKSLSDALGDQFDAMDELETGEENVEEESSEVSEEVSEEVAEETVAEGEEPETDTVEEELKDEIQEAADSDYNEPAPERWPAEIKQVYNELPPNARKAMLEGIYKPMQAKYTQSTQEVAQQRQTLNPMLEAMSQYRNVFDRTGANPAEVFRTQLAWAAHFQQVGPEQAIKDMSAAYGVGKQDVQGQHEEVYMTPVERAMQARIDAMEQQFGQQQQMTQQQQEQARQNFIDQRKAEVEEGLQSFINETKDGKPAHPHIEKVAPAIAGLIRGGLVRQTDDYGRPVPARDQIAEAYEKAIYLDPSIRPASSQYQSGQVAKAKAAQHVDVVAKTPSSRVDVPSRSLMSDLEATFDKLNRKAS